MPISVRSTNLIFGLFCVCAGLAVFTQVEFLGEKSAFAAERRGKSGLPLPRFVSLKSDPVNLRTGPGRKYPKAWVFRRVGLPLEVFQEFENWRRVRDSEGASGWILSVLLSGRRTALLMPWEAKANKSSKLVDLKRSPRSGSGAVARLEVGSLTNVKSCDGKWCRVSIGSYSGYLKQDQLWGVYANEIIR